MDPFEFDTDIIRDGDREYRRLKEKIKEALKKDLGKYLTDQSIIGIKGKKKIRVPIKGLDLPKFVPDWAKGQKGVGNGDGDVGDPLPGQGPPGKGGKAGDKPGEHSEDVEFSPEEITEILFDILELPIVEEKGKKHIETVRDEYDDISKKGPESLLDKRRTFLNAIRRSIASGACDPDNIDNIVIDEDDKRYKHFNPVIERKASAVIFYVKDISGSMTKEMSQLILNCTYWLDQWVQRQYGNIERRFIVFDVVAQEVSAEQFYSMSASGGTHISSGLKKVEEIVSEEFDPASWNIYTFLWSDGDNWTDDDSASFAALGRMLKICNLVCYGQVGDSGDYSLQRSFYRNSLDEYKSEENYRAFLMRTKNDIASALKKFLGKGR